MNIIEELEKEHIAELNKNVPEFAPGDTVKVNVKVREGERERIQAYEGVCIARSGGGLHENFTVRKISFGEGVERVFPIYSPLVDSIEVVRRGKGGDALVRGVGDVEAGKCRVRPANEEGGRNFAVGEGAGERVGAEPGGRGDEVVVRELREELRASACQSPDVASMTFGASSPP